MKYWDGQSLRCEINPFSFKTSSAMFLTFVLRVFDYQHVFATFTGQDKRSSAHTLSDIP